MSIFDPIRVKVDPDLKEIIPGYLENRQNDIKAILEALEKGDYNIIQIAGHKMKGTGAWYGFDTVTEIGKSIELAAQGKNSEEIRKCVSELKTYLERVEVIYE